MTKDLQIWHEIKKGHKDALKELYQEYYQVLFNYGKKMARDQSLIEDAIQETFISIWKYRNTTSVPLTVKQYMLKTFRNVLIRISGKQLSLQNTPESPDFLIEVSFDHKIIEGENAQELSTQINKALLQLTHRQREIIYYRFYEGLSFEEIAVVMNMRTRATYKLTARALVTLKEILGKGAQILIYLL